MTLTVSEIAGRILRPGGNKAALVERLRHWTREGLLSPVGEQRPGTGRRRRYEESAVSVAAVLNVLADRGIQVGEVMRAQIGIDDGAGGVRAVLKPGVRIRGRQDAVLTCTRQAVSCWEQKRAEGTYLFLILAMFADGATLVYLDEISTEIFDQHDGGIAPIDSRADSSLVINLTTLFARLKEGS